MGNERQSEIWGSGIESYIICSKGKGITRQRLKKFFEIVLGKEGGRPCIALTKQTSVYEVEDGIVCKELLPWSEMGKKLCYFRSKKVRMFYLALILYCLVVWLKSVLFRKYKGRLDWSS